MRICGENMLTYVLQTSDFALQSNLRPNVTIFQFLPFVHNIKKMNIALLAVHYNIASIEQH